MPYSHIPSRERSLDRANKATSMQLQESPSSRNMMELQVSRSIHDKNMSNMELQASRSIHDKKMTEEEFKEWLRSIDRNGDGCISREELRAALKGLGMRRTRWKSWRAMVHADMNHDKSIHGDQEVEELIMYAKKRWGIIVT